MDIFSKIAQAFEHGGIWMWPILALQVISFAILAERIQVLFRMRKINQGQIATEFEEPIRAGEIDKVIERAKIVKSQPIGRAILAGAMAAKNLGGKDEIQGKMDEILMHENSIIDRRTGFLTMIGNVATLMGLLGTITGMIRSFAAVAYANPSEKAALLSAGIAEAMNCTAYGLIVAIPSLIMYAIIQNRAHQLSEDLNQSGLRIFNLLSFSYEPVGFKSFRGQLQGQAQEANRQSEINN